MQNIRLVPPPKTKILPMGDLYRGALSVINQRSIYYEKPWKYIEERIGINTVENTFASSGKWAGWTPEIQSYLKDVVSDKVPFTITTCCRGGSKTLTAAMGNVLKCDMIPKYRVNILSGSLEQAGTMYEYARAFVTEGNLLSGTLARTPTARKIVFPNGSIMRILAASTKAARSKRANKIVLDEGCETEPAVIYAALPQIITASNLEIDILTTPHKFIHPVKDYWDNAEKLGFKRHHWDAYKCPWILPKTINFFKEIYDLARFKVEVLGKWANIQGAIFREEDLGVLTKTSIRTFPRKYEAGAIGLDWGYEHETSLVGIGYKNGIYYTAFDEGYKHKGENFIYKRAMKLARKYRWDIYADNSHKFNNRALSDKLSKYGLSVIPMPFVTFKRGMISNARNILEHKRCFIAKEHEKLILQLTDYHIKKGTDMPAKINDDRVDGFMLGLYGVSQFELMDDEEEEEEEDDEEEDDYDYEEEESIDYLLGKKQFKEVLKAKLKEEDDDDFYVEDDDTEEEEDDDDEEEATLNDYLKG